MYYKFGIEICVPMSFTEDDALNVIYRTFRRLENVRALASKAHIRPVGLEHSFDVDFEAFTIRRRIRMNGTVNFVNTKDFYCYGDKVHKVSEELYSRLLNNIEMAQKSFNIAANSKYELPADTWKYCENDVEVVKQVLNAQFGVPVTPKKVIFNNPATIVIWSDGTKTVVKRQTGDRYNKEAGLALCYVKKFCGNNTSRGLNDILKLANDKEEK